jgi:hypothetical protein
LKLHLATQIFFWENSADENEHESHSAIDGRSRHGSRHDGWRADTSSIRTGTGIG